jgi:methylglutaconyl-CoA hydratase
MFQFVQYAVDNRVARVTLNRPDKRNALNQTVVNELTEAFTKASNDPAVKVVQLHANGNVFSAGADLDYLQQLQRNAFDENLADSTRLADLFKLIATMPKPVVACVRGAAIAGGCGLATVCDFSLVSNDTQFGYTESRIGFVPAIVMIFLLRKIGDTRARDLMLTGRLIDAAEAERIGLVTKALPAEQLDSELEQLTNALLNDASAQSMALIKQMAVNVPSMTLDDALQYAAKTNAAARASDDCKRGIAAFLSKEKISW